MERGTVVLVGLDPTLGQEQRGTRPCVVISDPLVLSTQRFPLVGVVPLTSIRVQERLRGPDGPASRAG